MPRIETFDQHGTSTGWLLPVWHIDDGPPISQVYVTAIETGKHKGPHLHMKRSGLFCCISGSALLVVRGSDGSYCTQYLDTDTRMVVRAGTPAAIYNVGSVIALVVNMPSPPWRPDDRDDWPVEGWDFKL